jgi:hypothetical protein
MAASQRRYLAFLTAAVAIAIVALGVEAAPGQDISSDLRRCLAITDSAARLRCLETAAASRQEQPQPRLGEAGGWRLLRTPDPRGGPDAVSIMHTADMLRSDPDFAGLMLRCAEDGIDVLVIVVAPRPPRARPQVKFGPPGHEANYQATVVPPFTALLLPKDATSLVSGLRGTASADLSIEINDESPAVGGTVALAGLRPALEGLKASCPHR